MVASQLYATFCSLQCVILKVKQKPMPGMDLEKQSKAT